MKPTLKALKRGHKFNMGKSLDPTVALFAMPVPGGVKTRLQPTVGMQEQPVSRLMLVDRLVSTN